MLRFVRCLLPVAFFGLQAPLFASPLTAYEALLSVRREKGNTILSNIVEMRGVDGDPQPVQWTLLFSDTNARSGVREFVVGSKGVISERAPVRPDRPAGSISTMAASSLKLDSSGAFTTVNKKAIESKVGFSAVSYHLKNQQGVPVWNLRLFDVKRGEVASMDVSSQDGSIVSPLHQTPGAVAAPPASPEDERPLSERWVEGGGLVGHVTRWSERTWDAATNNAAAIGQSVQSFFVGRPEEKNP
jgi:hypothetical protein